MDTAGSCRRDTLGLALFDVFALALRDKGQYLQYEIRDKRSHQILTAPGIEQRHIQYADVSSLLFGDDSPLVLNLCVIAP